MKTLGLLLLSLGLAACGARIRTQDRTPTPPPPVTAAPAAPAGLDQAGIRKVIQNHMPDLLHCYDAGLIKSRPIMENW